MRVLLAAGPVAVRAGRLLGPGSASVSRVSEQQATRSGVQNGAGRARRAGPTGRRSPRWPPGPPGRPLGRQERPPPVRRRVAAVPRHRRGAGAGRRRLAGLTARSRVATAGRAPWSASASASASVSVGPVGVGVGRRPVVGVGVGFGVVPRLARSRRAASATVVGDSATCWPDVWRRGGLRRRPHRCGLTSTSSVSSSRACRPGSAFMNSCQVSPGSVRP